MGVKVNPLTVAMWDSGWFTCTTGGTYVKTHNLGSQDLLITIFFAPDSAGSPDETKRQVLSYCTGATSITEHGTMVQQITITQLTCQCGEDGVAMSLNAVGHATNYTNGHLKVVAMRVI